MDPSIPIPLPARVPDEPTDDELADLVDTTTDDVADILDFETQRRLWVRAIIPLLQLRSHDSDPSGRVQLAYDLMHIAATERVSRIMRSDLVDDVDSG
jgi:hypothetical protein